MFSWYNKVWCFEACWCRGEGMRKMLGRQIMARATKRGKILQHLRKGIVDGKYPPGAKLPVRRKLEEVFSCGPLTVQGALDQLMQEGFVEAYGTRGTFVVDKPPHLYEYVLPFPGEPGRNVWSRFWSMLTQEARRFDRTHDSRITVRFGVNAMSNRPAFDQLMQEAKDNCIAGILLPFAPDPRQGELVELDIPLVILMEASQGDASAVWTDWDNWRQRALDWLAQRGRKKVGVVTTWNFGFEEILEGCRQRGMTTREHWFQHVNEFESRWARNVAHLMFHKDQKDRPDALIVHDDDLLQHTTAGLVAAGVRVPDDLDVISHANFPWSESLAIPVQLLGFDNMRILESCVESLQRQREGDKTPTLRLVPAEFASEVERPINFIQPTIASPGR